MEPKLLITGATGFIGNFLVEEALSRNYELFVSHRRTSNIKAFSKKNINLTELDFSKKDDFLKKIADLPRFDYIIHNAGLTKSLNRNEFYIVNTEYTRFFIESLKKVNKVPTKFIYVSSLAAYGPGKDFSIDPVNTSTMPNPVTHYGKSKLEAEKYIINNAKIPYLIIRPTAVYGPGEKNLFESIKLANKGFFFRIGTQKQALTFIYVKDLCRLIFDAFESQQINKEYFASDGFLYSTNDLYKAIFHGLNKKALNIAIPVWLAKVIATANEKISSLKKTAPILSVDKLNELAASNWNCDIMPILNDIKFKANYNLHSGMAETIEWYKKEGWI